MPSKPASCPVYDVWGDRSRLSRESLGPLFTRFSMGLSPSPLDPIWERAYQAICAESDQFSRFTLNAERAAILFTCRSTESVAEIETLIERLDLLLELTNLRATMVAAAGQRQTA